LRWAEEQALLWLGLALQIGGDEVEWHKVLPCCEEAGGAKNTLWP